MSTIVQKWGNSLGIRIPQKIAKECGLSHGSKVDIQIIEDKIIIKPTEPIPKLEELMARITPENQHDEVDFGKAEGEEIW